MDHDATREQLELAALEPGGLDRLMAGDTATSQAVAAHLAGCPACIDELARLERASRHIREAVREIPPPDLKARTLASVRAEGLPRGTVAVPPAAVSPSASPVAEVDAASPTPIRRGRRGLALGWVAVIAAAIILSVATTSLIVGQRVDEALAAQARTIGALEDVTLASLDISAQPDAAYVELVGTTDASLDGSLVYSPATAELVVVATGLTTPPEGMEYRCWVAIDGTRQRGGKMFFSGRLAYWIGPAPAIAGVSSGATFGVSLVSRAGPAVDADPVLLGKL
jgi:anti-sigma factor RsiW